MQLLCIVQYVMERLMPSFSHKLWRVREELLLCVQQALIEYVHSNQTETLLLQ